MDAPNNPNVHKVINGLNNLNVFSDLSDPNELNVPSKIDRLKETR
jgi:hypothetical protein